MCQLVVGWGGLFFAGGGKKPRKKKGVVASSHAIFGAIFGVLWAIFALLVAAAGEHTGFSLFFRPRGLLGAAGTKIVRPWLLGGRFCSSLWPSLGQVACTGQPPHRRGRVSPDKRIPPCPGGGLTPTPTPPTWVGWVPGGRWGKAEHRGGIFFFCPPLDFWQ